MKGVKEKLNEKYILYQVLTQNLESMKQQLELVEQQLIELKSTSLSMDDVGKINEDNEVLMPLGSGCFGKGKVMDAKKILCGIGAGLFLSKDVRSAKATIDGSFKELERAGLELEEQMKKTITQINEIAMEIQEMAQNEA